ncbi:MAG: protein kinase [Planctomycetales bacterium]|nr:protein kinase [Planctomycetales bacterium]
MPKFRYQHGDQPLAGYTIEHGLGRGGFGEVYYAISDAGRQVALKAVQNFEEIELRGIAQCMNLKSPHLVTIFDVKYNDDGDPFVIMEYVTGPSLRELLDASPHGLGEAKSAFLLREIAKGLTYLHDCGVVHRDLKPHNIFYEDGTVKIGDYSLSKAITTSHRSGHTMTVGTVHYMAPEISLGRYDHSVDIYALGVILYEMLVGHPPYVGETMAEVLMRHLSGEPDLSQVEEPFRSVIRKALAKSPEDRYQSAQEMAEEVFGVPAIQESVTALAPAGLSVVANHEAAKIVPDTWDRNRQPAAARSAVLDATAPFDSTSFPGGSIDAELVSANTGTDWKDDRFGFHVGNAALQFASGGGLLTPEYCEQPTPGQWDDWVQRDPVSETNRRALGVIAIVLTAVLAGVLGPHSSRVTTGQNFFVVGIMALFGALGLVIAYRKECSRTRASLSPKTRLHVSLGGAAMMSAGWGISNVTNMRNHDLWMLFLSMGISVLVIDWRAAMSPRRPQRMMLAPILVATFIGAMAAEVITNNAVIGAAIMAAVALAAQLFSPWDQRMARESSHRTNWANSVRLAFTSSSRVSSPVDRPSPIAAAKPARNEAVSPDWMEDSISSHSRLAAMVLAMLFPFSGLHRFYVGKWFTGLLWFLTGGLGMIGQIIDLVMIATGVFQDSQGRTLIAWHPGAGRRHSATPVNQLSSIPAPRSSSGRYWRPTVLGRGATVLGGFLLAFAVVGFGLVPALAASAASGLYAPVDPAFDKDALAQLFGSSRWYISVYEISYAFSALLGLLGVGLVVMPRHSSSWKHLLRGVLGTVGIGCAGLVFGGLLSGVHLWHRADPAMLDSSPVAFTLSMARLLVGPISLCGVIMAISVCVLAWPCRRPETDGDENKAASI